MIVVGVDENGLGPRLGPLISTAVTIAVDVYDARKLRGRGRRVGVDDSKETATFGKMAAAEGIVLALVARLTGVVPHDADSLLAAVSLDAPLALRAPCPTSSESQCWGAALALPAFGGDVVEGERALTKLARGGVRILRARSAVACANVVNEWKTSSRTKLDLDLAQFERLLIDARAATDEDFVAHCGMIGGMRFYSQRFTHLAQHEVSIVEEARRRAVYRVVSVGDVSFEVDADGRHLPVALASMLGKYVREIGMERINRFYLGHDAELPRASGYHDPVTTRFMTQTGAVRRRLGIVDECFVRRA